jgi:TonB family protein
MTRPLLAAALASAALALAFAPAAAAEPKRAVAPSGLVALFSSDDYPAEAIRNREEGIVDFRITVGVDGRVAGCTVVGSSGSALLDSTTCRILGERARFTPARNAAGKAVEDIHTGRINWQLPEDYALPPGVKAATQLWFGCSWGEVARLALSDLDAAAVAGRAFAACASFEQRVAGEVTKAKLPGLDSAAMIRSGREGVLATLPAVLAEWRAALEGKEAG